MTWASLILGLIKLADMLMTYVNNRQLMSAGAAEQLQKDLNDVLSKSSLFKQIDAGIDLDTDDAVADSLRQKFGRDDVDDGSKPGEPARLDNQRL